MRGVVEVHVSLRNGVSLIKGQFFISAGAKAVKAVKEVTYDD